MRELNHSRLDLLKLDIEGAEFEVLNSMIEDGVDATVLCIRVRPARSSDGDLRDGQTARQVRLSLGQHRQVGLYVRTGGLALKVVEDC